jgi:hypothetical protein
VPLSDPDGWYEVLMNAQRGLSDSQSVSFGCALVLLLAEQVGDEQQLRHCVAEARAAALDSKGSS